MASNQRRRERYATDETYRERQLRAVRDAREAKRAERERIKRLRGWQPIITAPENEVIMVYDPAIFWPVYAKFVDNDWEPVHAHVPPLQPTHWRYAIQVPLA